MTIGERICQLRALAGLSQREMSDLSGLAESHVRLLETGARREPSIQTIRQIAETFGASLDWLISGTGDPPNGTDVIDARDRAFAARSPSSPEAA